MIVFIYRETLAKQSVSPAKMSRWILDKCILKSSAKNVPTTGRFFPVDEYYPSLFFNIERIITKLKITR